MERSKPLVSIIIPTYKREKILEESIISALNQTYEKFEIIVVDDNPPKSKYREKAKKIIKKYSSRDNFKYIIHKDNKGGGAARNTGIKNSKGKYIAFLDDDDLWMENKLEKQMNLFKKNDELGIVYCRNITFLNDTGEIYSKNKGGLVKGNIFKNMLSKNYIGTTTAIVKKKCFDKVGYFDENLLSRQDHDMFLRITKKYSADYVDEFLVKGRVHKKRISTDVTNKKEGWKSFINKWEKDLNENIEAKKKLLCNYNYEMGKLYYKNKKYGKAEEHLKKLLKYNYFNIKGILLLLLSLLNIQIDLFKI